jgi:hypothetical protein
MRSSCAAAPNRAAGEVARDLKSGMRETPISRMPPPVIARDKSIITAAGLWRARELPVRSVVRRCDCRTPEGQQHGLRPCWSHAPWPARPLRARPRGEPTRQPARELHPCWKRSGNAEQSPWLIPGPACFRRAPGLRHWSSESASRSQRQPPRQEAQLPQRARNPTCGTSAGSFSCSSPPWAPSMNAASARCVMGSGRAM